MLFARALFGRRSNIRRRKTGVASVTLEAASDLEGPLCERSRTRELRWTPFSGPKWGVAKVEPAELNTSWS